MVELKTNKFGSLPMRIVKKLIRCVRLGIKFLLLQIPYFHFVKNTGNTQHPRTLSTWFVQKVLGFNRQAYWPVHFASKVTQPQNILVGVDCNPGIEPGCYIQGIGEIRIGDFTQIACNVAIISANHDALNLDENIVKNIRIGVCCWIGANAVILPGVELGDFTIVGAGTVVTKSFSEGYCVIAGNPAKKIRELNPDNCVRPSPQFPYVGYLRQDSFEQYRKDYLWI